ncbi:MAG: hypothetical protein LBD81_00530 [Holosporaceae bacterium]|jgi:hypothetical protein|nr:hypothetical protein [Holosporaceae bacterium]
MNTLWEIISSNKFRGIISLIAAVVMYYTPDHIDAIIETCLTAYGLSVLAIDEKKQ